MCSNAPRIGLLVVFALVVGGVTTLHADPASSPLRPDPALTPGDVLTTEATVICVPNYTKTVRHVPRSVKNQVYRQYGITQHAPDEYEIDHLISLELGGS